MPFFPFKYPIDVLPGTKERIICIESGTDKKFNEFLIIERFTFYFQCFYFLIMVELVRMGSKRNGDSGEII